MTVIGWGEGRGVSGRVGRNGIDLGKGKRMLVRGGKLDPKYQITVPEDLDAGG